MREGSPRRTDGSFSAPSETFLLCLAALLSCLHAVLAATATADKSVTSDEIAHLTAGHAYNVRGDFRLHPENGNLPQRLAGLPFLVAGDPLPPADGEDWRTGNVWHYGHEFLYGGRVQLQERLLQARSVMVLLSAATGLLVFFWSRHVFGTAGGFVSLTLFAFCPSFLAHGPLATSDVAMTFFFLAATGAWWRHLNRPGALGAALSCLATGLAFVAKFSAVLLPPMLAIMALLWALRPERRPARRAALLRAGRSLLVHAAAAWTVIWCFYDLRAGAFAPGFAARAEFQDTWDSLMSGLGAKATLLGWIRTAGLLPEAWLHGFAHVLQFSRGRGAFASGEYSVTGWVWFFPWAFLIKTTLPALLLFAAAGLAAARRTMAERTRGLPAEAVNLMPLAVLGTVYLTVSLASNLNIGHRHILPLYPALFIAAGGLAPAALRAGRLAVTALCAILLWHAAESWRVRPHYLAYFNQIAGGPAGGWRHLVDSSLDWGQDLPGLKAWLDVHASGERVYLSYFGNGSPRWEGIRATELPMLLGAAQRRPWHALEPGIYAISATCLQHPYSRHRGPWNMEFETEFQRLRRLEPDFLALQADPSRRAALLSATPLENWRVGWATYESLRFARLCHYLRLKGPDEMIGYSILIFRLNEAEIRAATGGSIRDWQQALEAAAAGRPVSPPDAAPRASPPPPRGG